jgi:excinuclease UvrABC ATPase subunit
VFTTVSGVSGSGKSSLVSQALSISSPSTSVTKARRPRTKGKRSSASRCCAPAAASRAAWRA